MFYAGLALAGLSGLALLGLYLLPEPEDPFQLVRHPAEPWLRTVHIFAAPVLVFAVGMLWRSHIQPNLTSGRRNRLSGWSALLCFFAGGVSGYLYQVAVDETVRSAAWTVHVIGSPLLLAAVAGHWLAARRKAREAKNDVPKRKRRAA
ncbi:MAG: hypothetical protein Kow00109_00950 [Acidobacteriota bacterium]